MHIYGKRGNEIVVVQVFIFKIKESMFTGRLAGYSCQARVAHGAQQTNPFKGQIRTLIKLLSLATLLIKMPDTASLKSHTKNIKSHHAALHAHTENEVQRGK